jgi:hypothetical protein
MAVGAGILILSAIEVQRCDITGCATDDSDEAIATASVDGVRSSGRGDSNTQNRGTPRKEKGEEGCEKHHG